MLRLTQSILLGKLALPTSIPLSSGTGEKKYFVKSNESLGTLLSTFLEIFRAAGIVLFVYSMYQIVLAFQSDNTENKIKAISLAVTSLAIINIKTLLNYILTGTGVQLK